MWSSQAGVVAGLGSWGSAHAASWPWTLIFLGLARNLHLATLYVLATEVDFLGEPHPVLGTPSRQ